MVVIVEILVRICLLKLFFDLEKFISLVSGDVFEVIVRGFIKGGNLNFVWKFLLVVRDGKRMLKFSIYVKLILELGRNFDKDNFVIVLLEEFSE